jgi:class 3 adenylate cyclase/tetratricopeptide (TPR) repeat protein
MGSCPACDQELPAGDFRFCPWCAAPLAEPGAGQRKTVTVLFADLVDSTQLGAGVDPEVLRTILGRYWAAARTVVEAHGGVVEKFIGDAAVGVFGLPTLHEDDAVRAVRAAVDLLASVERLSDELDLQLGVSLAVRIGINTGETLGGAGGETLMSGDAANVAARLQAAAEPGTILIGAATYPLLRDSVEADVLPPLTVKGKTEPLTVYRLRRLVTAGTGQVRPRRFAGPMVGRVEQMRALTAMYDVAVADSTAAMVTVVGEPGFGKSRLIDETLGYLAGDPVVVRGRCLPYGEAITYWPTIEVVRDLLAAVGTELSTVVTDVDHADEIVDGLQTMLGHAQTADTFQIAWAFRRLVEIVAERRPVVVVVDDLQWADTSLLDLLDHLTARSRQSPILLVTMARPELLEIRPEWGAARPNAVTVTLRPLPLRDAQQLAAALIPGEDAAQLRERIVTNAEGVPLFIEELVAMLVDGGQLVAVGGGGWRPSGSLGEIAVPATVQSLVSARLDRLAPDHRSVLEASAVLGNIVYQEAVTELLDSELDVASATEALIRSDLLRPAESELAGHEALAFGHLLTRDLTYRALPKTRRADLHVRAAWWFEQHGAGERWNEVVAHHLAEAALYRAELGRSDESLIADAADRLLSAARRSLDVEDPAAAVRWARRAQQLLVAPSSLAVETGFLVARALRETEGFEAAAAELTAAVGLADVVGDESLIWRGRLLQSDQAGWNDTAYDVPGAFALCQRAIEALSRNDDHVGLAEAYRVLANLHHTIGHESAGSQAAIQALHHATLTTDYSFSPGEVFWMAMAGFFWGELPLAQAGEVLTELGDRFGALPGVPRQVADWLPVMALHRGDVEGALAYAQERVALLIDQGASIAAGSWWGNLVVLCQRWQGDLEAAATSLAAAAALRRAGGETGLQSTLLAQLAFVQATLGRNEEARQALTESRAISFELDRVNEILFPAVEGLLLAHAGDASGAEAAFEASLAVAATTEFLPEIADIWAARSVARELTGDTSGALDAARQALACCERKGSVPPLLLAERRVAELEGSGSGAASRRGPTIRP